MAWTEKYKIALTIMWGDGWSMNAIYSAFQDTGITPRAIISKVNRMIIQGDAGMVTAQRMRLAILKAEGACRVRMPEAAQQPHAISYDMAEAIMETMEKIADLCSKRTNPARGA
jgi:hypothetical protein